jgi:hypothetical protein
MNILSYNISWECMTNSINGSAGTLGNICALKSKNNFYCKDNFIKFLEYQINKKKYDIIALQEASNLDNLNNILYDLKINNYFIYTAISGNEKMITLIDKNKFKIIKHFSSKFKIGRPFHIFILKNILNQENIIFVNLHYVVLNDSNNINLNISNILTNSLKFYIPNYELILKNFRIILAGDFNHEVNLNFKEIYNMNFKNNILYFEPFKNLNYVMVYNPPKTCCYKNTFNSEINYNADLIMDSIPLCINKIVKKPFFLKEISDHLPVETLILN